MRQIVCPIWSGEVHNKNKLIQDGGHLVGSGVQVYDSRLIEKIPMKFQRLTYNSGVENTVS